MRYDLFVSYARRDNQPARAGEMGWISAFVEALQRTHRRVVPRDLDIFMDKEAIAPGQDWRARLDSSARDARMMLAFVSANYFASKPCEGEWELFVREESARGAGGEGIFVVFLADAPGFAYGQKAESNWHQDLLRRQFLDGRAWFGEGPGSIEGDAVSPQLARLDQEITLRLERIRRSIDAIGSVERGLATFVGRREELGRLRRLLTGAGPVGGVVIVHGLGGLGKSALVNEYARSHAGEYSGGRWWIPCEREDDLERALLQLVTSLEVEFSDEERKNVSLGAKRILATLEEKSRTPDAAVPDGACLVVLDNVDWPELLSSPQLAKLPRAPWLHVVATTRLGQEELVGQPGDRSFLPLDELNLEDAVELVARHQPGGRLVGEVSVAAARELVERLGGFTLAVEAVAVYLGLHPEIEIAGFAQRLVKEGLAAPETVATGADVAQRLRHRQKQLALTLGPLLAELGAEELFVVECASLLPADFVPLPWLREWTIAEHPELADATPGYPQPWASIQRRLIGRRLLVETADRDAAGSARTVRMHRLVQELVTGRADFPREDRWNLVRTAVGARVGQLQEHWRERDRRWELDPLRSFSEKLVDANDENAATVAVRVSGMLQGAARLVAAEALLRKALASRGDRPPDDLHSARLHHALGRALMSMARYAEAETHLGVALSWGEGAKDHDAIATAYDDLAVLRMVTGHATEAAELYERAIRMRGGAPEPDHRVTFSALNNLGQLYQNMGDLEQAEIAMRRALDLAKTELGPTSEFTETASCNLGRLLFLLDRNDEALVELEHALSLALEVHGPEHPSVATTMLYFADALKKNGRNAEAREMLERAETITSKAHGDQHPSVARILASQGGLALKENRVEDALGLAKRALDIGEAVFGPEHPNTLVYVSLLAKAMLGFELPQVAAGYQARVVTAGFRQMRESGQPPPGFNQAIEDFDIILEALGLDEAGQRATLADLARPFEISIGEPREKRPSARRPVTSKSSARSAKKPAAKSSARSVKKSAAKSSTRPAKKAAAGSSRKKRRLAR